MRKTTFFACALFFLVSGVCIGQSSSNPNIVRANSNACEQNPAEIDLIKSIANEKLSRIFVISRAGKDESETINAKRLSHIRRFLTTRKHWDLLNVIYARGDKVTGLGQIEFYVGDKLVLIIQSNFGKTPCMDCCGPDILANPQSLVKKRGRSVRH